MTHDEKLVRANAATLRKAADLLDAYEQLWIDRVGRIADLLDDET